jgi:sec-independent protein translocase protein TatB
MFDVSMVELAVIALVALLVLGPEKLPRAARTVGLYVRKAKQSWYSVRGEIERELAADELKRSLKRTEESVRSLARIELDPLKSPAAATATAPAYADPAVSSSSVDPAVPVEHEAAAPDAATRREADPT